MPQGPTGPLRLLAPPAGGEHGCAVPGWDTSRDRGPAEPRAPSPRLGIVSLEEAGPMRFRGRAGPVAVLTAVIGAMSASTGMAAPAGTTRVELSTGGTLANAATDSWGSRSQTAVASSCSRRERRTSPGDANGMRDVFVRNTRTARTTRRRPQPGGIQANGDSFGPVTRSRRRPLRRVRVGVRQTSFPASGCSPAGAVLPLHPRPGSWARSRVVKRLVQSTTE